MVLYSRSHNMVIIHDRCTIMMIINKLCRFKSVSIRLGCNFLNPEDQ